MAFNGKIKETNDNISFKRYVGIAPIKILAINPNKAELEALGFTQKEEPVYLTKNEDGTVTLKLDFIVRTISEKCGIETTNKLNFRLTNKYVKGSASGKYHIMDVYGQTAWATKEEIQAHQIPMYKNGPANISEKYFPLYDGEEALNDFARVFLGIPNVIKFVNGVPAGMIDNPADAEGKLDCVKNYFNGDLSELKEVFLNLAPNNWVKALYGIRTTDEGRQYQVIYNRKLVSGGSNQYKQLSKSLQENLAAGRYADTFFGPTIGDVVALNPIVEFKVEATEVVPTNAPMPVGGAVAPSMPDTTSDMPF